jgi:hypothetical protein
MGFGFDIRQVYCTGVATPACLSYELVLATSPYITTVVCEVSPSFHTSINSHAKLGSPVHEEIQE